MQYKETSTTRWKNGAASPAILVQFRFGFGIMSQGLSWTDYRGWLITERERLGLTFSVSLGRDLPLSSGNPRTPFVVLSSAEPLPSKPREPGA